MTRSRRLLCLLVGATLLLLPGQALASGSGASDQRNPLHSAMVSSEPVDDPTPAVSLGVAAIAALGLSGGLLRRLRQRRNDAPQIERVGAPLVEQDA